MTKKQWVELNDQLMSTCKRINQLFEENPWLLHLFAHEIKYKEMEEVKLSQALLKLETENGIALLSELDVLLWRKKDLEKYLNLERI